MFYPYFLIIVFSNFFPQEGGWIGKAETVATRQDATDLVFDLRKAFQTVQNMHPGADIKMPREYFAVADLCKTIHVLRHGPPVVAAPAVVVSAPVAAAAAEPLRPVKTKVSPNSALLLTAATLL